jgi:hypothetical protein
MRILLLTTYPIVRPMHGGQIRAAQIKCVYEACGHDVSVISVREEEQYLGQVDPHCDVPFPKSSPWRLFQGRNVPLINDLLSGRFGAEDEAAFARVAELVPRDTRILEAEQPWLWPVANRINDQLLAGRARLIYSSQNIEWELKEKILASYQVADREPVTEAIRVLETQCAKEAYGVLAVSIADAERLRVMGARRVLLAPNGVADRLPSNNDLELWRKRLPQGPYGLYVASAHPPNVTGFFSMFDRSLAFLPPDRKLVIVGGVTQLIADAPAHGRWRAINESRIDGWGQVDDGALAVAKQEAHVFVLPVTTGGGSNLKTAEALRSGKHVLGTSVSFRGFESFLDLDNVHVADEPAEFRHLLRDLLNAPPAMASEVRQRRTEALLWSNTLASLPQLVAEV